MLLWTTRGQCGICPPDQLPKCTCVSVILQKQQMLKVGLGGHSDYNTTQLSSWTPCEEKSMQAPCSNKGGLISEVFHFCSNLKKNVPNPSPEHSVSKEKMLRSVIWQLFLDLSQSEKSSEIMPPLGFDPTSFNSVCIENCSDQM